MSTLGQLRGDVADLVADATSLKAFDYLPARLAVPCAVVMPGAPYLVGGELYGSYDITFTIELIMGTAANSVTQSGLDTQIENTIKALKGDGYSLVSVSQPYAMEANNATYLAVTIQTTTTYRP